MAYTKTTWVNQIKDGNGNITQAGTPVNATNMNNIENGVSAVDTNLTSHLADNLYQTAGGTATAITLTINETLVTGFPITFIASANNAGAATTINSKKAYKPGTTTSPTLIAGKAYTFWYNSAGDSGNGCFFIKASADGDALVSHVLAGKKFSSDIDTGLVGTMPDYSGYPPLQGYVAPAAVKADGTGNLVFAPAMGYYVPTLNSVGYGTILANDPKYIPANIRRDASIFGITGTAPILPAEYVGQRMFMRRVIAGVYYPFWEWLTHFTLDCNTLYFSSWVTARNIYKYNMLNGAVTTLLVPSGTTTAQLCISDDGSVIYAAFADGTVQVYNGSTWTVCTGVVVYNIAAKAMTCNSDGSELYYFNTTTIIKKYVKATSAITTVLSDSTIYPSSNILTWVNDGSLWVYYNVGNGVMKKVSISTGTVLKIYTAVYSLNDAAMNRNASAAVLGTVNERNGGTAAYLCQVNSDGSRTLVVQIVTTEYSIRSITGRYQLVSTGTTGIYNIYEIAVSSTPVVSGISLTWAPIALSEDYSRMVDTNTYTISNYLFQ